MNAKVEITNVTQSVDKTYSWILSDFLKVVQVQLLQLQIYAHNVIVTPMDPILINRFMEVQNINAQHMQLNVGDLVETLCNIKKQVTDNKTTISNNNHAAIDTDSAITSTLAPYSTTAETDADGLNILNCHYTIFNTKSSVSSSISTSST